MIENTNLLLGILVLVLVLVSAFFSLVETALTTCSKAKIHRLAKEGNKKAIKTTSTRNKRRKEVLNISIDQKFYIKNKFKRVSPRVVKCSFCTQKINNNHFTR